MFQKGRQRTATDAGPVRLDTDRPAVEAAQHDPRAFEALYRKYVAQVYSFALYETRDHHAAEDLTEQVFLQALVALPRFREMGEGQGSTFRAWLLRICRNALANQRRAARHHPETPLELAPDVTAPDDPAARALQREEAARVWRAVAELPAERRRALVLRFVHEMSAAEIAAVLGRSEGSVRVLIHRALRSVRSRLASPEASAHVLRGEHPGPPA